MDPVTWAEHHTNHMRDSHGLSQRHVQEAVEDVDAIWFDPDPASKSGISVRVIGYSHTLREILCVILIPAEEGRDGWDGVNGWPANAKYRRIYRQEES